MKYQKPGWILLHLQIDAEISLEVWTVHYFDTSVDWEPVHITKNGVGTRLANQLLVAYRLQYKLEIGRPVDSSCDI